MPLKWKIYSLASWYHLLWLLLVLGVGTYMMLSDDDQSYAGYWVMVFPLVMIVKPILSIRFISHFKTQAYYTKNEFIFFSLYFLANIIFTFYVAVAVLLMAVQENKQGWNNSISIAAVIVSLLFLFASGYSVKYDMPLKNLIRNQRFTQANTIGKDL